MTAGYRALRFDEVEEVPWKAGMRLRPVRSLLGLRAFGAGGFVGREPGDLVVERHAEADGGRGHQELYVVLRGRARFVVDGERVDAPAGTLVLVEPEARREAVAVEAGTAVLALGAPPTYVPAGEEYMARVRALTDRPAAAREVAEAGLRELPDSPGARYAMALAAAAGGDRAEARRWLDEAVAMVPDLRREAGADAVLAGLLP
jgi:hypothetical protein